MPSVSLLPEMIEQPIIDLSRRELIDEVRRYLEAVDAFRAEGHEPRWRPEGPEATTVGAGRRKRLALGAPPIP